MKFTTKGIGWLIFGIIVCLSASEATDISGVISSLLLGCVFIAMYLMKQRFTPYGLGWFAAGGLFLAFSADMFFDVLRGVVSGSSETRSDMSSMLFGVLLSALFFYMFYRRNKDDIDLVTDVMNLDDDVDFPNQEEVFGDYVGDQAGAESGAQPEAAENEKDVPEAEFVVEDGDGTER